jgi:hypothetical protein
MQRWRHVRTQSFATLIAVSLAVLFAQGCTTRRVAQWYIEPGLVELSSKDEIERTFRSLFADYSSPSDRLSIKEISTGHAQFLFVTAFNYRGPGIFSVYAYERIKPDNWRLRVVAPVVARQTATVSFEVDGETVSLVHDGAVICKLNGTAAPVR